MVVQPSKLLQHLRMVGVPFEHTSIRSLSVIELRSSRQSESELGVEREVDSHPFVAHVHVRSETRYPLPSEVVVGSRQYT